MADFKASVAGLLGCRFCRNKFRSLNQLTTGYCSASQVGEARRCVDFWGEDAVTRRTSLGSHRAKESLRCYGGFWKG